MLLLLQLTRHFADLLLALSCFQVSLGSITLGDAVPSTLPAVLRVKVHCDPYSPIELPCHARVCSLT
jgi:hypothetical protein